MRYPSCRTAWALSHLGAALCGRQGQPPRGFGHLALQHAPPAPGPAQGGPQPRPASANWRNCSSWPATPALLSTQAHGLLRRLAAWPLRALRLRRGHGQLPALRRLAAGAHAAWRAVRPRPPQAGRGAGRPLPARLRQRHGAGLPARAQHARVPALAAASRRLRPARAAQVSAAHRARPAALRSRLVRLRRPELGDFQLSRI